ncbi:NotI family restriction endonuclease [Moritella viscosa]|uniref:NotI family restriction endonuclease n=1 Tax=Moritella viscosa TaxID=80854 RepID=UPI00091EC604|nr:NotI family restriction endonuclease [Moritella viscosa]SHO15756.1 BsiWI [Moritella viscosa]SHO16103.1 BsiWI [Moritella viscosa]SHO18818.1 BsiWI [Moritella viscosa]
MSNQKNVAELYGRSISKDVDWVELLNSQQCSYLNRKCVKNRKSEPEKTIGTCSVTYGKGNNNVIICPHRLLERKQIFTDCIHLLNKHEPGNELHIVPEVGIPGGNVDYFLVSVRHNKVKDFVGIELQTLDTTGTVWPFRQRFANSKGLEVATADVESKKPFGMNWKMTAKTILVQMHHKLETFEHLNKHLVLVVQNHLLDYMKNEFSFSHISDTALTGDSLHFHSYKNVKQDEDYRLELNERKSTDVEGISMCLGLESEAKVELEEIISKLESKINESTLLTL